MQNKTNEMDEIALRAKISQNIRLLEDMNSAITAAGVIELYAENVKADMNDLLKGRFIDGQTTNLAFLKVIDNYHLEGVSAKTYQRFNASMNHANNVLKRFDEVFGYEKGNNNAANGSSAQKN